MVGPHLECNLVHRLRICCEDGVPTACRHRKQSDRFRPLPYGAARATSGVRQAMASQATAPSGVSTPTARSAHEFSNTRFTLGQNIFRGIATLIQHARQQRYLAPESHQSAGSCRCNNIIHTAVKPPPGGNGRRLHDTTPTRPWQIHINSHERQKFRFVELASVAQLSSYSLGADHPSHPRGIARHPW